jgi:hypothetical protein
MVIIRKHKGRSGQSVFEWRVYRVIQNNAKTHNIQLAKCRSQERAEQIAAHYRSRDLAREDA